MAKKHDLDIDTDNVNEEEATEYTANVNDSEQSGPTTGTFDDLEGLEFDTKALEEARKKLYPPPGDWIKSGKWEHKITYFSNDKQPGDLTSKGRMIWSIMGKPEERVDKEGNSYQPVMLIQISPDMRFKQDDTSKYDIKYKLFHQLRDVFIAVNGYEPKKPMQLLTYFIEEDFVFRTMNGDSGPISLDIKQKGQRNTRNKRDN